MEGGVIGLLLCGQIFVVPRSTIRWNVFRPYQCPLWVISRHQIADELRPLCATSGHRASIMSRFSLGAGKLEPRFQEESQHFA